MSSPCAVRFVHRDMENAGLRKDGMFYCTQGCANMGRHVPQGEPGKFVETDVDHRDMQRAYPAPTDQKNGAESFVAEVVGRLKAFELTNEQGHALLDAIRRSVREPEPKFYGPGIASFIVGEQKKLDLKADAERLAELRAENADLVEKFKAGMFAVNNARARQVEILIAVYEECAARGLRFGGGS